jgi:predicted dehydrogenase
VRGTEAGAETTVGGDELTVLGTDTDSFDHYTETTLAGDMGVSGRPAQDAAFVEGVATGDPPAKNTVQQGLAVQRLIETIYDATDAR